MFRASRVLPWAALICLFAALAATPGEAKAPDQSAGVVLWLDDEHVPGTGCTEYPLVLEKPDGATCSDVPSYASNATGQSWYITFSTAPLNRTLYIPGQMHLHLDLVVAFGLPLLEPMLFEASVYADRDNMAAGWLDCSSLDYRSSCDLTLNATARQLPFNTTLQLVLRMVEGNQAPGIETGQHENSYLFLAGAVWGAQQLPATPPAVVLPLDLATYGGIPLFVQGRPYLRDCDNYELKPYLPEPGDSCSPILAWDVAGMQSGKTMTFAMAEGLPNGVNLAGRMHFRLAVLPMYADPAGLPDLALSVHAMDQEGDLGSGASTCGSVVGPPPPCDVRWTTPRARLERGAKVTLVVHVEGNIRPFFNTSGSPQSTMLILENATWDPVPQETTAGVVVPHRTPGAPLASLVFAMAGAALGRRRPNSS